MEGVLKTTSFAVLVYIIVFQRNYTWAATMNDTKTLRTKLLTGYSSDIRPVLDQDQPVYLNVSFRLISLLSLDEVFGSLTFVGQFFLEWTDESMLWDPDSYGGVTRISFSQDKVWFPELVLMSAANEIQFVGNTENDYYNIHYYANGYARFSPSERIQSSCVVNVETYPFDTQVCEVFFSTSDYHPNQLVITPRDDTFDRIYYQGNAVWDLVQTSVGVPDDLLLLLTFKLKRRSTFIVINVLLPITLLGFLNVLVFLLVPESGERISYCITVLLSISVFMTITSDTLPKSSQPVPYISYKLMIDVIISMLITLVTILNLRLHHRDSDKPVPSCLKKIYLALCCKWQKKRKSNNHFFDDMDEPYSTDPDRPYRESRQQSYNVRDNGRRLDRTDYEMKSRVKAERTPDTLQNKEKKVTWKHIAALFDGFAFIFFAIAVITSLVVFLTLTRN